MCSARHPVCFPRLSALARTALALAPMLLVPLWAARPSVLNTALSGAVSDAVATVADPHGSGTLKRLYPTTAEAANACRALARQLGGTVVRTSGTPSMEPLIHGATYVVIKKRAYEDIRKSDLLVYMGRLSPRTPDRTCTLHRAVDRDRAGWLMSGDNNRWTESWDRVTPDNYLGTVVMIFEAAAS